MELLKKKYNAAEVKAMLSENCAEFENRLAEQRARITDLVEENKKLQASVEIYKNKEENIIRALTDAEDKAREMKRRAETEYALTSESLKRFSEKWREYFNVLKEKYPLYPTVSRAESLKNKLDELLRTGNNKVLAETLEKDLQAAENDGGFFDPKKKIEEYIAATDDNGFNLEEVLNPGALRLEDLCKELGLLEDAEQ